MPSFQANGTLKPNQISSQVQCLMTVQDEIFSQVKCLMTVQDVISNEVGMIKVYSFGFWWHNDLQEIQGLL